MPKRYIPERGEIRHDGVRQYFEEDFYYLSDLHYEIAVQRTIVRLTEEPALRRHIAKLERMYGDARFEFFKKWNK